MTVDVATSVNRPKLTCRALLFGVAACLTTNVAALRHAPRRIHTF